MPGLVNPSVLAATRVAVDKKVRDAYAATPDNLLWYKQIAAEIPSNGDGVTYYLEQMLPRLREWIGARHIRGMKRNAKTVLNAPYEGTVGISMDDIENDNLGVYSSVIEGLGRSAALWPNDLVEAAILDTTTTWIDGQPFFNGNHPLQLQNGADTVQSNLHTAMSLTAANFGTVRGRMRALKGEDNKPLGVARGRKLLLVVPQALEDTARRIVGADMVGYLSNNSSTASDSNLYKEAADVLVLPELDANSATTWYLFDVNGPIKPFLVQIRKRPTQVIMKDKPTDDNVFHHNMAYYGVDGSGAYAYGLWQLAHKCTA